jgi:transcriptional regulator with XRE-family HTH domain
MPASMHNPAADLLAKTVVELRTAAGLNQRQLAAALAREQNYVARIETGQRRVDLIEWIQILRVLSADPERELARIVRQVSSLVSKPKKRP